jgi:hypothetical protein
MKKTILIMAAGALIFSGAMTSCYSSAEKVENAQNNVVEAQDDLNKANQEYLSDIENYKKEASSKIEANNKSIADFSKRIESQKLEAKSDYQKKIDALDKKNSDLKKKLDEYKANGKDNWEMFKEEFNRDMEALGNAFKDLTVKNTK